MAVDQK